MSLLRAWANKQGEGHFSWQSVCSDLGEAYMSSTWQKNSANPKIGEQPWRSIMKFCVWNILIVIACGGKEAEQ
jgi:hypothetical protein